jgi:hypothetical protein
MVLHTLYAVGGSEQLWIGNSAGCYVGLPVMCVSGEKKVSQRDQANPTWATQMVCG